MIYKRRSGKNGFHLCGIFNPGCLQLLFTSKHNTLSQIFTSTFPVSAFLSPHAASNSSSLPRTLNKTPSCWPWGSCPYEHSPGPRRRVCQDDFLFYLMEETQCFISPASLFREEPPCSENNVCESHFKWIHSYKYQKLTDGSGLPLW